MPARLVYIHIRLSRIVELVFSFLEKDFAPFGPVIVVCRPSHDGRRMTYVDFHTVFFDSGYNYRGRFYFLVVPRAPLASSAQRE